MRQVLVLVVLSSFLVARGALAEPGNITLASTSDEGVKGSGEKAALSADGTTVAFQSGASNLDPADRDTLADVYLKDLETGDITLASTSSGGVKGNDDSFLDGMSAEGTTLGFYSESRNLDPADRDALSDVFVKDLITGDLTLASTSDEGVKGNGNSYSATLSADGTTVGFHSDAKNLDPGDQDRALDLYVKDLSTGGLTLASTSDEGRKGNGPSYDPDISADGSIVVFEGESTNLDSADGDDITDIYVKDLATGDISLVSISEQGIKGNARSSRAALSADGTKVVFESEATNLDPVDTDSYLDIYVKDLLSGDLTLVSTSDEGLKGNGSSLYSTLSADGTFVAFSSIASNLDPDDGDFLVDVYVKEMATGDIRLASTSDEGEKGNGYSYTWALSSDGTQVGFWSFATNLDPADDDSVIDVYVKELGPPSQVIALGHAHTDYNGDGEAGLGDVHVVVDVTGQEGRFQYWDLRPDPPGRPARGFACLAEITLVVPVGSDSTQIDGSVNCRRLPMAATFTTIVTDHGVNPPTQDSYDMILYDSLRREIYEWSDLTTVGLGDLVVTVTGGT